MPQCGHEIRFHKNELMVFKNDFIPLLSNHYLTTHPSLEKIKEPAWRTQPLLPASRMMQIGIFVIAFL